MVDVVIAAMKETNVFAFVSKPFVDAIFVVYKFRCVCVFFLIATINEWLYR